ncbi:hypothetical protein [Massilia sp. SYSU DXS3249]
MNHIEKSGDAICLTQWRKAQAVMLYHFTSVEYLAVLHKMVGDLIAGFVEPLLKTAETQGRDRVLMSKIWGERNLSKNWENNAWPFLKDLQASLAVDIALRTSGKYRSTAVNESLRGVAEYSTEWATPGEEKLLNLALATISEYAAPHDKSVDKYQNKWNDYRFAYVYPAFISLMLKAPRLQIRGDVIASTGEIPPETGVYVALDDPHASLQFVWKGADAAKLRAANTFNEIGLAALRTVGREALWFDEKKMFAFATSSPYATVFKDSVFLYDEPYPSLAPAAVARQAFSSCSSRWALVEIVPGEFEDLSALFAKDEVIATMNRRVPGGSVCDLAGYYFSPAHPGSRRFLQLGEIAPKDESEYGSTYWQWDENQS